ncbi:hypothetical protein DM01DRAFT_1395195 [Hesseltinella vesiculosa]|uniref:Uncharacterized protein n=1 Tax=Hesseltinella vesiculosa TaxID=101127 RepID=A0A1X2GTX0_9FUNG|nr:hypothetical protein DM01DRAFT_1395195 [Hesseltinella vesiculosa]
MPAYQYYQDDSTTSSSTSSPANSSQGQTPISMHALSNRYTSQPDVRPKRSARKQVNSYYTEDEDQSEDDVMDVDEALSDGSDSAMDDDQDDGYDMASDDDFDSTPKRSSKKQYQQQKSGDQGGVFIPMGSKVFEKILRLRHNEQTGKDELLIKYKHTSFHRAEWVPVETIEGEHLGKHRVKKFMQKWLQDGQTGDDFKEHLKVDRIIDEGELADPVTGEPKVFYLVKWRGLMYDASTWESEADMLSIDAVKIQEFHARRQIPQGKLSNPPRRPPMDQFVKYTDSPKYRYGNELRQYQLEGLNWLRFCYYNYRSCILADEMGLGKTVQSVAFLNDIYRQIGIRGPFLVVAPLSTIPHWERAFQAWTDLNVIDYRGNANSRGLLVETEFHYKDMQGKSIPNKFKFDALITTYEMASVDVHAIASASQLRSVPWQAAVFDEAHRLKNKQSKVGEILKLFKIDHKLLLTGTPLQNNLDELYSLLSFMQPDVFNDEKQFFAEYGDLRTATQVEKLQGLLKPIMLRRFKEDVEKSIPVKEETVIEVELTNSQKKWYRAILERNFSFLKKGSKTNKEMPHLRNIMMQLRKCCIHPYLLEGAEEVIVSEANATTLQAQFETLIQSSGKLVLIDKLLKKLIKGNHKVLIFSQFTSCLDILADYLRGRNYAYERIDGSIPGEQRQASIDRFSTLPIEESFVFLLCTRAGGVGINLTAADTCIIFDSDWNPQNDLQAQARCHRIGQTKPVQIYRLICRSTYEKDMFDRAGMKLGLDKAVMQRSNADSDSSTNGNTSSKSELNKKEIEDLLKKGAYGAVLDEEASAKFCEEDIDQILERRTTVIRHEGNEKGSVFSKASFAATEKTNAVELDDPDFWDKWAAQANIDTTEIPEDQELIMFEPRRRRQVQRFGLTEDEQFSGEENEAESDVYEDDENDRNRKRDQPRLWTASEKTKYERKLMIYGYGAWNQMAAHFSRRTGKDLCAVTRALIRLVLPLIGENNEEDRKLREDIEDIMKYDEADDVPNDPTVPFKDASKKLAAEYRSFLLEAPPDYAEHLERKGKEKKNEHQPGSLFIFIGRNLLLRIQMLYLVRDRIVPTDWEEAKKLPIPKVSGALPVDWWGDDEDRDLLLGIVKHGYQQYLTMRNDPEFHFYGKKFDDSKSGGLDDDDNQAPMPQQQQQPTVAADSDEQVYMWPSKADIGIRIRRIIAAFLREEASEMRRLRLEEKDQVLEDSRMERLRQREERMRLRRFGGHNRWHKRQKADFLRTVLSFGVEFVPGQDKIKWDRFLELAGLEGRTDDVMDAYYHRFVAACKEIVKRGPSGTSANASTPAATNAGTPSSALHPNGDDHDTPMISRESSIEPSQANGPSGAQQDADGDQEEAELDLVPYDKARRSLKRIDHMKRIREQVLLHPDFEANLLIARKTSGLPNWWRVPDHDRALLQGICKHGYGRSDLMLSDPELPFDQTKQEITKEIGIQDPDNEENNALVMEKLNWPKDIVLARRIDSLCELITRPRANKQRSVPQPTPAHRQKRLHDGLNRHARPTKIKKLTLNGPSLSSMTLSSDELDSSSDDMDDLDARDEQLLQYLRRRRMQHQHYYGYLTDDDDSGAHTSSLPTSAWEEYDSGDDTDEMLREANHRMKQSNLKKKKVKKPAFDHGKKINRAAVNTSFKAYLNWKRHYLLETRNQASKLPARARSAPTKPSIAYPLPSAPTDKQRRSSILSSTSSAISSIHDDDRDQPPPVIHLALQTANHLRDDDTESLS